MPLKKYVPPRPYFFPAGSGKIAQSPLSPGPVLVPVSQQPPPPPPTGGAFSSAFSNAFNV